MSKTLIIVVVIALILGMYGCSSYNGFVQNDTNVQEKWAQVQTQYQRRADLIPNLVRTVQGAANFEKSTLTAVIQARASATQVKFTADQLTPGERSEISGRSGSVEWFAIAITGRGGKLSESESESELFRSYRLSWKELKIELPFPEMILTER